MNYGGIGDYVHYHLLRYETYGISRTGEENRVSYEQAIDKQKKKFKMIFSGSRKLGKENLDSLSRYYSDLLYSKFKNDEIKVNIDEEKGEQNLSETLTRAMNENSKQENNRRYTVEDFLTKKVLTDNLTSLEAERKIKGQSGAEDLKDYETDLLKIRLLIINLKKACEESNKFFDINKGRSDFKALYDNKEKFNSIGKELLWKMRYVEAKLGGDYKPANLIINTKTEKFIGQPLSQILLEVKNFLKTFQASYFNAITGHALEDLIALDGNLQKAENKIIVANFDKLMQILRENKLGNKKTEGKTFYNFSADFVDLNQFIDAVKENNKFNKFKVEKDGCSFTFTPSSNQGTVDVQVDLTKILEDTKNIEDVTKKLQMSIKNYNDTSSGVTILSSTPFTFLLFSFYFDIDFINHYLNLIASHPFQKVEGNYAEATDVVKLGAVLRGLAGDDLNNFNEVLLINNRQKQTVYVSDVMSLYNIFKDTLEKGSKASIKDYVQTQSLPPRTMQEKYNKRDLTIRYHGKINTWEGEGPSAESAKQRITNFLIQLHELKINVALNNRAINTMSSYSNV